MAFTNLAVFGGAFFTPILVGKITHTLYWWWSFYLVSIFCAACLPAVYFFCPETSYRRDASLNLDLLDTDNQPMTAPVRSSDSAETEADKEAQTVTDGTVGVPGEATVAAPEAERVVTGEKATFVQSLALFNGRKSDEFFLKLLLRPFPLLFFQPAFLWACLIQGVTIGWTVFIGVILAQFFLGYPLWWDEVKTGYAYTSAFIGAVMGFIIAGALADWSARYMTKKNNGIYEPEFRIILVIPQLILSGMGLFGWGITSDGLHRNEYSYAVPLFFFGCEVAGMVIGAVASSLYIVDAYRTFPPLPYVNINSTRRGSSRDNGFSGMLTLAIGDLAIEGFTCMIIFKNFFSFALTFKAYEWLIQNSTRAEPVFNILGAVQIIVCFLSLPLCMS